MTLQVRHTPNPQLYPGPSDRSSMLAQELAREPVTVHQAMVRSCRAQTCPKPQAHR